MRNAACPGKTERKSKTMPSPTKKVVCFPYMQVLSAEASLVAPRKNERMRANVFCNSLFIVYLAQQYYILYIHICVILAGSNLLEIFLNRNSELMFPCSSPARSRNYKRYITSVARGLFASEWPASLCIILRSLLTPAALLGLVQSAYHA